MNTQWRFILDGKCDGYYNMAADEAILANYHLLKTPTLRIYGWNKPFISLGYKQQAQEVLTSLGVFPFTRRITAGAAILHDKELTYSITCSTGDLNLTLSVKESYMAICAFIADFYRELGLEAKFAGEINSPYLGNYGNFCFSSCEHFDFIINGKKIGGNAQRRKRDLIFQHGSIPQDIDFPLVQKLIRGTKGIEDKALSLDGILGRPTDFFALRSILSESFCKIFGAKLVKEKISQNEQESIGKLLEFKYQSRAWNLYRELDSALIC